MYKRFLLYGVSGLFLLFTSQSAFAEQEHGLVKMQGSIIATPCAISTDDIDQTIDMGITSVSEMVENGYGVPHSFSVRLINCVLQSNTQSQDKYFQTTFDGPADNSVFRVEGAEGIGLQIRDVDGNIVTPGQPLAGKIQTSGSQRLDYNLRLIESSHKFKAGEYYTTLRFKVDYY